MIDQGQISEPSGRSLRNTRPLELKYLFAILGLFFIVQLVGLEVVGGDPDRFFRPLKAEMVRSLGQGQLPLWSDRFGFGMPLAAQSEIGAFYPVHWLIYPLFGAGLGYRVSMVLHQALAAAVLFQLARKLGASGRGAVLSALIYILGGFPTIQASKEWAVLGMAWLPPAFLGVEMWLQERNSRGLSLLTTSLSCLALIGHFQLAQITSLGLLVWVLSRTAFEPGNFMIWPGLIFAVVCALLVASPQLLLSWQYAQEVEATSRSVATLSYYSYPIWNFTEFLFPLWTRLLQGGPEGVYWTIHQTTEFEACQFIGTAGLIFAVVGVLQKRHWKRVTAICMITTVSLLISTLPQWSPGLYASILKIPGMGLFRCPSRYGILMHFGLTLLAGLGFEKRVSKLAGLVILIFVTLSILALWRMNQQGFAFPGGRVVPRYPVALVFGFSALIWLVTALLLFIHQKTGRYQWLLISMAAGELFALYFAGPTRWGWSLHLPGSSQALMELRSKGGDEIMLAGALDNMPVTAGLTSAGAYFGVTMPPANESLKAMVERANLADRQNQPSQVDEALARLGVTHQLQFRPDPRASQFSNDPMSKVVLGTTQPSRPVYLRELAHGPKVAPPKAWLAGAGLRPAGSQKEAFARLYQDEDRSTAPVLLTTETKPVLDQFQTVDANATLECAPDLLNFTVRHSGPVILVVRRTFDKGWRAQGGDGRVYRNISLFGGLQGVLIDHDQSNDIHEVHIKLDYWPTSLNVSLAASFSGLLMIIGFASYGKMRSVNTIE